jgi:hypothetical protein
MMGGGTEGRNNGKNASHSRQYTVQYRERGEVEKNAEISLVGD